MNDATTNPLTADSATSSATGAQAIAFEVLDVLEGLFLLEKRSATLEGSAPLKAVQFCTPYIQGNAAGFHLLLADSVLIRKQGARVQLGTTEALEPKLGGADYTARVAGAVERGLIAKGGYWHKKLARCAWWREGTKLHLWTGFLIRPQANVWMLVSGAFNRRCSIDVQEHVIPDDGALVPLVVTLDLSSVTKKETWLEKEVACIVPLRPDVTFAISTLDQAPEIGQRYIDYYGERWSGSSPGNYVGAYRKLVNKEPVEEAQGGAACKLVIAGGPKLNRVRTFDRFATPRGWSRTHPRKERLQYIDVRNIFPVKGRWDGDALRDLVGETPEAVERARADWARQFGESAGPALDRFLLGYVRSTHGPRIGEPYMAFTPWCLVSSRLDGPASPTGSTLIASTGCAA